MTIHQEPEQTTRPLYPEVTLDIEEIEVSEEEVGQIFMRERQDVTH